MVSQFKTNGFLIIEMQSNKLLFKFILHKYFDMIRIFALKLIIVTVTGSNNKRKYNDKKRGLSFLTAPFSILC
jgi:hypothetical protein